MHGDLSQEKHQQEERPVRTASIAFISILFAALALPASADNDKGKGHGQGQGQSQGKGQGHGQGKGDKDNDNDQGRGRAVVVPNQQIVPYQQVVIIDRDRDKVRTYYRNEYVAGRCPPGLAKKNNGCLPPGQVNRTWVIGQPLPPEIVYYPMPRELWTQLTPPPYGYEYAQVNNDIVLISVATRVIAALLGDVGSFD
ncbi:DUF1236 domain-containing protein [Reyranella sp.]|uniref:DUF1236 domain-containing protein n=1 Tax=Reyranella sp. TaxID=1929291 RepID=UPI00272521B3|nr:DUF1236 domain-containing protein [Reyranella sp.]MDO8972936.1 RcnB family protein [Reyranella sp.]